MFKSVIGRKRGIANIQNQTTVLSNGMELINIPADIATTHAKQIVETWLRNIRAIEVPSSLKCNLDCKYCYIRDKWMKNIIVYRDDLSRVLEKTWKILEFYDRTPEPERFVSAWGAEPCANIDTLEYLVDFCVEHNAKLKTSTNGTYLSALPTLDRAVKMRVLDEIQVSLDGPAHIQNRYRPFMSKTGETFPSVIKFIKELAEIGTDNKLEHRLYTICSTLYLSEETPQQYEDCIRFFAEPDTLFTCQSMPMRVENHLVYDDLHVNMFEQTMRVGCETLIDVSKQYKRPYMDHYTHALFYEHRRSGCANCSAMRTQIAVDLDGNLYMCHGPITTTSIKPYCVLGNIDEGYLDFSAIMSNLDMIHCNNLFSAICSQCELKQKNIVGSICSSCPPNNLSIDGMPFFYDHYRCKAYQKALPYWQKIFKEAWVEYIHE